MELDNNYGLHFQCLSIQESRPVHELLGRLHRRSHQQGVTADQGYFADHAVLSDDGIKPHRTLNPHRSRSHWISWRDLMKQLASLNVAPQPDALRYRGREFVLYGRRRRRRRRWPRAGNRSDDAANYASDLSSGNSAGNTS